MSAPTPITLEEYAEVGPEFFAKFNYVKTQLPADSDVEEVLTIMETLAALVLIKREDDDSDSDGGKIGFLK